MFRFGHRVAAAAMILCLLAACKKENNTDPDSGKPEPVVGEWQTVPAEGGTVKKDDITFTIPGNTFTGETQVGVTQVKTGETLGEDEVSPFYKLTLPVTTAKPVKVSIKSSETYDDICIVAHAPGYDMHNFAAVDFDIPLETTYKDGEYTAEIPAFDNGESTENGSITFGLARIDRGGAPKADNPNKVENVGWHLNKTHSFNIMNSLGDLEAALNQYIAEAIRAIHALGFKVEGDRDIPFSFESTKLKRGEYGRFIQSARGNKWSGIILNKNLVEHLGSDHAELRKTIIHELLHYYQSDYDKRWALTKAKFDSNGEFLMIYESGGTWIERFVADHSYSNIMIEHGVDLLQYGVKWAPKGEFKYQAKGYGLGLVLEWFSQKKGDKSIVTMYEHWRDKGIKTHLEWLEDWCKTTGYDFFDDSNFRDFVEAAADGKVAKGFDYYKFPGSSENQVTINNENPRSKEYDIWKYGGLKSDYYFYQWTNSQGTKDVKGRELVVSQQNENVYGLAYLVEMERYTDEEDVKHTRPKKAEFLGYFMADKPLVVTDEGILSKLVAQSPLTQLFLVTGVVFNKYDEKVQQSVCLAEPDKLELSPKALSFSHDAGTQRVTVDTNKDNISVTSSDASWLTAQYDKTGKTLDVSVRENGNETPREGKIILSAPLDGGKTIADTLIVSQEAGVLKNFVDVRSIELKFKTLENFWAGKICYTSFDCSQDGYVYASAYSDPDEVTSFREGDYQIISAHHSHSNYATGGSDETMSFTMKIDKDLNGEGSFSITRKSWATAGMGMDAIGSTCNMSMSGSFGPDQPNKTYWSGYGILIYDKAPQSFSFSVGGFTAYFEPDNHLDVFNYSTSSTNAVCYILLR